MPFGITRYIIRLLLTVRRFSGQLAHCGCYHGRMEGLCWVKIDALERIQVVFRIRMRWYSGMAPAEGRSILVAGRQPPVTRSRKPFLHTAGGGDDWAA